ncbi:MAG: preprotein translocase subunit SecG [Chthoniobacterales bacterium]|nr:preprotein translocase subunit SecG [Chthoniobacterales bacterium]
MSILLNIILVLYVLVTLFMILVILMQRPKSEGLGAAFGGGVTENIFGAQTTNVLTKITGWLAGIFFAMTFILSVLYAQRATVSSSLRNELMKTEGAGAAVPGPQPAPSSAVGPPGTVTNPTPAADMAVEQDQAVTAADQAVGVTAPAVAPEANANPQNTVAPENSAAPSPSAAPQP